MNDIQVKKTGRRSINTKAFETISKIKKGSFIIFPKKDWKLMTLPGAHILRRHTGREFQVQTLLDDSGWKITAL